MKNLLIFILIIVSQISFAQSVTISPTQGDFNTSSSTSINLRPNTSDAYMRFSPNGSYKGYVGVFSGTNDVDFGTGFTNSTGKLNLVIGAIPSLVIDNLGKVKIVGLSGSGTRLLKVDNSGTLTIQPSTFTQNIPFAAFRPAGIESGPPVGFIINGDGTTFCTSGTTPLFAPINLPDGATITQVRAFFVDNSVSGNVQFEVTRNNVNTLAYSGTDFISEITSSGNSSGVQFLDDTTITSGIIDNTNYFYFIRVIPTVQWDSTNIRIKGIIITCQY